MKAVNESGTNSLSLNRLEVDTSCAEHDSKNNINTDSSTREDFPSVIGSESEELANDSSSLLTKENRCSSIAFRSSCNQD